MAEERTVGEIVIAALRNNASRLHARPDCVIRIEQGACECGKTQAEVALALIDTLGEVQAHKVDDDTAWVAEVVVSTQAHEEAQAANG